MANWEIHRQDPFGVGAHQQPTVFCERTRRPTRSPTPWSHPTGSALETRRHRPIGGWSSRRPAACRVVRAGWPANSCGCTCLSWGDRLWLVMSVSVGPAGRQRKTGQRAGLKPAWIVGSQRSTRRRPSKIAGPVAGHIWAVAHQSARGQQVAPGKLARNSQRSQSACSPPVVLTRWACMIQHWQRRNLVVVVAMASGLGHAVSGR